jgi:hypothetical protein
MTNQLEQNETIVSGSFVLTPAAGKKLIGMAVAALPEVKWAYEKGRLAIANGTTTGYVIEALTGKPIRRYDYCVGVIAKGIFAENPDSDHTMMVWEKGKEIKLPFAEFLTEFKKYEKDDVFIKGANAVDPYGFAGGLQTNPFGGSWAQAFGIITARGLHCIVPVGLEKMIPSVIEASRKLGQLRLKYSLGNPPGLIPLTSFKVVTELEALKNLSGAKATAVAGGGLGGSEGSRSFVVEGTEEQVKKAFSFVMQVHGEPPVEVSGKVEAQSHRLPEGL